MHAGARRRPGLQPRDPRRAHLHLGALHLLGLRRDDGRAADAAARAGDLDGEVRAAAAARVARDGRLPRRHRRQRRRRRSRAPGRRRTWARAIPVRFSFNPKHWVWSLDEWSPAPVSLRGRWAIEKPAVASLPADPAAGPLGTLPALAVKQRTNSRCRCAGTPTDLAYDAATDRFLADDAARVSTSPTASLGRVLRYTRRRSRVLGGPRAVRRRRLRRQPDGDGGRREQELRGAAGERRRRRGRRTSATSWNRSTSSTRSRGRGSAPSAPG